MEVNLMENRLEFIAKDNLVAANLEAQMSVIKDAMSKYSDITEVTLNLKNVTEIDSMGINLVVGLYKQVNAASKKFSVNNVSRPILNLFNLFKLTSYFDVS